MRSFLLDLMICRLPGLRVAERIELVKKFDREEDFSLLSKKDIDNFFGRITGSQSWNMADIRLLAEKDIAEVQKFGIHMVSLRDDAYPPLLREIYDPPVLLFYRGALPDPEKPLAAVVGTRKPAPLAAGKAFELGQELGEAGIPVVSGLALGIDSMAHRGNLEAGAPTVAVLGSSPEQVYPTSNRNLARRILEAGGIILSEYPPGTPAYKWNFPARNRIISGLARGTVIVEAPEKSGALITARCALEHNRDLWVDGPGLSSPRSAGTARLAEDGAKRINSALDILTEWNMGSESEKKDAAQGKGTGAALASSMAKYLDIKDEQHGGKN